MVRGKERSQYYSNTDELRDEFERFKTYCIKGYGKTEEIKNNVFLYGEIPKNHLFKQRFETKHFKFTFYYHSYKETTYFTYEMIKKVLVGVTFKND